MSPPRRLAVLALVSLGAVVSGGGCSSEELTNPAPGTLPRADFERPMSQGDTCDDPTGDIISDATTSAAGTLKEPAGIDLVQASALVDGANLKIAATTVAPWSTATKPSFFVSQGDATVQPALTWEVRFETEQGPWTVTLVQFPGGLNQRQAATVLDVPVAVDGTKLTATIPRTKLPVIATTQWLFGTTAGVSQSNRVLDECLPFANSTGGSTPPSSGSAVPTEPGTTATTAPIVGAMQEKVTAPDGAVVTVTTIDDPALATRTPTARPIPDAHLAAIEVSVCASGKPLEHVGEKRFAVELADGTSADVWAADDSTNDPRFPADTTLRGSECATGWITFEVKDSSPVAAVLYDASGVGAGPFVTVRR